MKNRLFLSIYIAAAVIAGSGCSKFLEEKSQSEVIPKTTADFRELLIGSGYFPNAEPANFLYYMDDDVELNIQYDNGSYVGTSSAKTSFPAYTWQPSFVNINGMGEFISENPGSTAYYQYYNWIMGCNAVLDNINNALGSQQERDRIRAEALAVRSLYYFRLVNLYGQPYNYDKQSLSVPLKLNSSIKDEYMSRETVAAVYDQIVSDLNEAARLMDPLPIVRKDYHINQPAIHILLSRVYLYMENWQRSVEEADKVFAMGAQWLNMNTLTAGYYLTYNNPEVEWLFGGSWQAEQSVYMPSLELISGFAANDARKKYGFSLTNGGSYLATKLSTGAQLVQTLRSSEACLNRAEAYMELNNQTKAMEDLNTLRRNRIQGYVDENITDKELLKQAIREERRKEFCYEGFRWFDLRRYGMPAISHRYQNEKGEAILTYTLKEKDPMYTLPFANSLLLRNSSLKQNDAALMGERHGN